MIIKINNLEINISDKLAEEIIAAAVKVYNKSESPLSAQLKTLIHKQVRIPGTAIEKANPGQIRRALADIWYEREDLKEAVLNSWVVQHPDIMEKSRMWVEVNPSGDIQTLLQEVSAIGSEEQIRLAYSLVCQPSASDQKPETTPELDSGEATSMDQPTENSRKVILAMLRQVPEEDGFWNEIEKFFREVKQIAAEKLKAQLHSQKQSQLAAILRQYGQVFEEKALALQIAGNVKWDADGFPAEQADEIIGKLDALHTILQSYEDLNQNPRLATPAERTQWLNELCQIEDQVIAAYQEIQSRLKNVQVDHQEEALPGENVSVEVSTGEKSIIQEGTPVQIVSPIAPPEHPERGLPIAVEEPTISEPLEIDHESSGMVTEADIAQESSLSNVVIVKDDEELEAAQLITNLEEREEMRESGLKFVDEAEPSALGEHGETDREALPAPDSLERANIELQQRISQHDLPIGYWLSWGMEQNQLNPVFPSWLIAVAQGTIWSIGQWPEQSTTLRDNIREFVGADRQLLEVSEGPTVWLMLASGLYLNLFDTNGNWGDWIDLAPTHGLPYLDKITQIVRNIAQGGVSLDPISVQLVANAEEAEQHIQRLAEKAKHWLQLSRTRTSKILRSTQVWHEFVRVPQGELYQLVEPVAADQRSLAEETLRRLESWQSQSWLNRQIQRTDRLLTKRSRPIDGEARNQIFNWVEDICDLAEQWAMAVQQSKEAEQGRNWSLEQIRELGSKLDEYLPIIHEELQDISKPCENPALEANTEILLWTIKGLQIILSPNAAEHLRNWPKPPELLPIETSHFKLVRRLANALFYYPELVLNVDGTPDEAHIDQLVPALISTPARSAEEAIKYWLENRDYRFIGELTRSLPDRELWEARSREALRRAVSELEQKHIDRTNIEVEQALLEGLVAESELAEYRNRIESIKRQAREADLEGLKGISIRNLESRLQSMRSELSAKRQERLIHYRKHWEKIVEQLPLLASEDEELRLKIIEVVEKGLKDEDLRSVSEYLAHLDSVLTGERNLVKSMFDGSLASSSDALNEFQELLPNLVNLLEPHSTMNFGRIRESVLRDGVIPTIPMNNLPKPHRDEVARALEAWRRLKTSGAEHAPNSLQNIGVLMSYLGFTLIGNSPVSIKTIPEGLPNFQYWRVAATSGNFSPVAQFGSQRNGYYDVIGIWDRPGIDVIGSQVNSLMQYTGNQPTILFYFHYLTPARRELLLSTTHKNNLPMIIVDEAVILFLARLHESRLPSMFQITLPYAALNPYFPTAAGRVPPEVYKGRREMVLELTDFYGSAIVYGGRQLGKSALLRQVQRDFHHPENGHFVIYEDIKLVGDPAAGKNYQVALRDKLAQALYQLKIIDPQRLNSDLDKLLAVLRQNLAEKNRRLLLLLDEADHFLDADAAKNFNVIHKLKDLMDQSGRQFKIVLAGLHNVQRFQHISNQPLAHLGHPIEIGPLDPGPARELLVSPLHALGYRFGQDTRKEDFNLVLQILSYTNYHPGLIQLFGSYLVEHLEAKYQKAARPPFAITRADIETVYRNNKLREEIYNRFNWTLALDLRYEVITLALILEQWKDQNGFDRTYTSRELHEKAISWWPVGFGDEVTPDRFRGFLVEMRGLGVLSMSSNGSYRLRSPNLVALMGTREEIEKRMETIIQGAPPEELALESYHAWLEESEIYSPLSFAQEQILNNSGSGVVLIFGSRAVGFNSLDQALQRLLPKDSGAWKELKITSRTSEVIHQQLSNFVRENSNASSLIAFRELEGESGELAQQVQSAIDFCRKMDRKRTLRVCFALNPQSAWQWHKLSKEVRESIEDSSEVVFSLKRWDELGIRQQLEMSGDIVVSDRLLSKVLNVTGGWPLLLDEIRVGKDEALSVDRLSQELESTENPIGRSFISALEIYEKQPRRLIQTLRKSDFKEMIIEDPYIDVLSLLLEDLEPETIENLVEYLEHMGVIVLDPHLTLEPVVDRLWHEA